MGYGMGTLANFNLGCDIHQWSKKTNEVALGFYQNPTSKTLRTTNTNAEENSRTILWENQNLNRRPFWREPVNHSRRKAVNSMNVGRICDAQNDRRWCFKTLAYLR